MYQFDQVIDRRNTGSLKWDVKENELPMWVADMDFPTAPEIVDAIIKRAAHGIYGYATEDTRWAGAYCDWWNRRHGLNLQEDWLVFATGVVPALSAMIRKLSTPGENVVVMTPVYSCFFNCILNNGRNALESRLHYENGCYSIDFEDLEKKLQDKQTRILLLCNPHNPTGNIWDKETLLRIGEMAIANDVLVISDEIHCDITVPGKEYVPFASVSKECSMHSVTCVAPTKTFNIAGLHTAAVFTENPHLRHKVWRGINTDDVGEGTIFSYLASTVAFEKGEPWLTELNQYLSENRHLAEEFIDTQIPSLYMVRGEATYLGWIDIRKTGKNAEELSAFLREKTGLFLSSGAGFRGDGDNFLRLNLACPRVTLQDGLERLKKGVNLI